MRDRYANLREGLVGAWCPSIKGEGRTISDLSNQNRHMYSKNSGGFSFISGKYGKAINFTGAGIFETRVPAMDVNDQSLAWKQVPLGATFAVWFNAKGSNNTSNGIYWNSMGGNPEMGVVIVNNTSSSFLRLYSRGVNNYLQNSSNFTIKEWQHFAWRINTNGIVDYFIDGELLSSTTTAYVVYTPEFPENYNFTFGGLWTSSAAFASVGDADDLRRYDRPLDISEIRILAQRPGIGLTTQRRTAYFAPPATDYRTVRIKQTDHASLREGLVGAWCPSIAGDGFTLPDLSGYGNHGTLTNMDSNDWVSSQYGRALDFDGSNDLVTFPSLPLTGTGPFSVLVWLKALQQIGGTLFGNYLVGTLQLFYGTQYIGMWLDNNTTYLSSPLHFFTTNTTCMVAQRFVNGETRCYLDAVLQKTGFSTANIGSTTAFRIGTNTFGGEQFAGQILQVSLYNRALSESEIRILAQRPGIGLTTQRRTVYYELPAPPTRRRNHLLIGNMF